MGRRRKDGNPLGMELRVYWHHGQFIYRHRDGTPESLGTDLAKANERARVYNDPDRRYGTLGYFLDLYIAEAKAGRLLKKKSPRTIADYDVEAPYLKAVFGKLLPDDLVRQPNLIAEYRDRRIDPKGKKAPVRANRELSLLSAMYSWLIEKGHCPGLKDNPVLLIARNPESPKERYVEDAEYQPVFSIAQRSVCMAMKLAYSTLQRPEDLIKLAPQAVREKTVAGQSVRIVSITQGKTGRTVDIEATAEIEEALRMLTPDTQELGQLRISRNVTRIVPTLIHTPAGKKYTLSGLGAMLRRYCIKSKVQTFGLMDVRAKGATDMYLDGIPLEKIQMLMGHKSVQTTEIYIKRMLQTISIARPNDRKIA